MWWDFICKNAWRDRYNKSQDALDECYAQRNAIVEALCECEDALDKCLGDNKPVPVVQDKDKVIKDGAWMTSVVSQIPDCQLAHFPFDGKYWLASKDIWKLLVAWDWVDSKKYMEDIWDCENYAILFKGRADYYFGLNSCAIVIDYSSGHGYNMIFYPDGTADIFEPQNDAFISVIGRNKNMYGLSLGAILV